MKEYATSSKFETWLEGMLKFCKDFKHHLQLGRSLLKQELELDSLDLIKCDLKKKSELLEMIDILSQFLVGSKIERTKYSDQSDTGNQLSLDM
jgi:hypothetical protein